MLDCQQCTLSIIYAQYRVKKHFCYKKAILLEICILQIQRQVSTI